MKAKVLNLTLITLFASVSVSAVAQPKWIMGLHDFFAPIVNEKAGLVNTIPAGSIVYEKSNDSFYGLNPDGAWVTLGSTAGGPRSEIRVVGSPGGASTNTAIKRLSSIVHSIGPAITYTDSSTDGAAFTINEDGIYAINYLDSNTSGGSNFGISLNATDLSATTGIFGLASSQILAEGSTASANHRDTATFTGHLNVGDIVRPHSNGDPDATNNATSNTSVFFHITKVSD